MEEKLARLEKQALALDARIEKARKAAESEYATFYEVHTQARWRPDRNRWTVRRNGAGFAHIAYCKTRAEAVGLARRVNAIIESIIAGE